MVNTKPVKLGKNIRQSFAHIDEVAEMPNLIEVQKNSYQWFLDEGLRAVFKDISSITDYQGNLQLDFIDFTLDDKPKYPLLECKERDVNYAAPLRVRARLINKVTGEIKESDIYMGDFPLMTDAGTFIINGAERVIVSQLVRSPGVYYGMHHDPAGKKLFDSTVIPNRGAWLEYDTDSADVFSVRIDKNRKLPITTFIRSLLRLRDDVTVEQINADVNNALTDLRGTDEEIYEVFGRYAYLVKTAESKDAEMLGDEALLEVYRKLRPGEPPTIESAVKHLAQLLFDPRRYDLSRVGRYKYNKKLSLVPRITGQVLSRPVADPRTGEILFEAGALLSRDDARLLESHGVDTVWITTQGLTPAGLQMAEDDGVEELKIFSNGMVDMADFTDYTAEELKAMGIRERVRFAVLSEILDMGLNREEMAEELTRRADELVPKNIRKFDIYASINYMCGLRYDLGTTDDIDHLGNRRIRSVGELLQNQFRIGFARMERVIRERMTTQAQDIESITLQAIINSRPVMAAVKEFFGSSPLSQFMDQTNPLAELTHKRRLSALGPGGLSRDRAGFEVRDVHYSHYGRMCPIETPEGPNIGLISYLATFARINEYGFVEAPYRPVDKATGKVLDTVQYMTADVEDEYIVAQANEPLDENGHFVNEKVSVRYRDSVQEVPRDKVDYMDVSPKMVVSVATAMIPFLENDDANRALMGANMQRQAVPLIKTESPYVGTGMEYKAAHDCGVVVVAKEDGHVSYVDADRIIVTDAEGVEHEYELVKMLRSNQGTCINQRPIVVKGEEVKKGDVLADGPATANGEVSLGRNMLIGFMTWEGYNYEDAVLINEKLVRDDLFTSIHIEEYETEARDTKLGPEEITREIPNVGDDMLGALDERGIIHVGAEVHSGDILVGKVTPKGETELNAEERLLRAIFGEKAREVRDTSLKVPHGEYGIVVDIKVFTPENSDELSPGVNEVVRVYIAQKRKISVGDKMAGRHGNKGVISRILPREDMPFLPSGEPVQIVLNPLGVPSRMNIGQILENHLGWAARALGMQIENNAEGLVERLTGVGYDVEKYGIPETVEIGKFGDKSIKAVQISVPVFDGAHEKDINDALDLAGIDRSAKTTLYDGRTGEQFDNPVTVGYMYYLKLHHLVDDKIHARSTGPYSLVTQQPLGGKAQFGGQRFGEMEVWALEAYGAAYTLQEILTVKSDDVVGRVKTYESIVKGENVPQSGVPESFKVLVKELQSLGLDIKVLNKDKEEIDLKQTFSDDDDVPVIMSDDEAFYNVANESDMDGYGVADVEDEDFLEDDNEDAAVDSFDDEL